MPPVQRVSPAGEQIYIGTFNPKRTTNFEKSNCFFPTARTRFSKTKAPAVNQHFSCFLLYTLPD